MKFLLPCFVSLFLVLGCGRTKFSSGTRDFKKESTTFSKEADQDAAIVDSNLRSQNLQNSQSNGSTSTLTSVSSTDGTGLYAYAFDPNNPNGDPNYTNTDSNTNTSTYTQTQWNTSTNTQMNPNPTPVAELPIAQLSGYPQGNSNADVLNITVSGSKVAQYEFVVLAGMKNCEEPSTRQLKPVSQKITNNISTLPQGPIKICVWGIDADGNKQVTATEKSWTKKYLDCGTISHGGSTSRPTFAAASVAFNQTCSSTMQQGICKNGTVEWIGNYFPNCSPAAAANCGSTPHLGVEQRTRFEKSNPTHAEGCRQEPQTRTCNNGSFSNWSGSYQQQGCTPQAPRNCYYSQVEFVAHNSSKTFYESNNCSTGKSFSCSDGTFSPSDKFRYIYTTCSSSSGGSGGSGGSCPPGYTPYYFRGIYQGCQAVNPNPPPGTNRCGAGCSPLASGGCYCQ